jgi:hypothetical protein
MIDGNRSSAKTDTEDNIVIQRPDRVGILMIPAGYMFTHSLPQKTMTFRLSI